MTKCLPSSVPLPRDAENDGSFIRDSGRRKLIRYELLKRNQHGFVSSKSDITPGRRDPNIGQEI